MFHGRFLDTPRRRRPHLIAAVAAVALALVALLALVVSGYREPLPAEPAGTGGAYVPPGRAPNDSAPPAAFTAGSSYSTTAQVSEISFTDIPVVSAERDCRVALEGPVTARLYPNGSAFLVNTTLQRGGRRYPGLRVYDREGRILMEYAFSDAGYRAEDSWYLAGGKYIVAFACDYSEVGEVRVLDNRGRSFLTREVNGWVKPVMSSEGSWLALFNQKYWTVEVFGPGDQSPAWSARVSQGASGFFVGDGPRFLLSELGRARLFDRSGRLVWSLGIPGGGRWSAVSSPDGRYIAATTEDPDSTIYLYSVDDGALVWSQFLVGGGDKHVAFSPDNASLAIYDIGQHSAIYKMNLATGEILWRFYLDLKQQSADTFVTINDLQYDSSGQRLVADITKSTMTGDAYVYSHYLLFLTAEGRAVWICPLGWEVDVDLSAVGGRALVTTNNLMDIYADINNSVTLVSFSLEEPPGAAQGGD